MTYQTDLFDEALLKAIRPGGSGRGGTDARPLEEPQVFTAFMRQRALTMHLMERVASSANLNQAYKRVRANKGAAGADGMTVGGLRLWLAEHKDELVGSLIRGTYQPSPVLGVEIPKPGGGMRQLGIPTVVDRLVQQAIMQVLQPIFDPTFSEASFGFRPGRGAHDALTRSREYVAQGYKIVVDLDLEKFFDRVNHDILMSRVARRIGDKRLLRIIRRFLEAGMMRDGVCVERYEGTPQGGPLSPLLANILLDDLDKVLEARGHRFVRYADDCNIYVQSQKAGARVMANIAEFLEGRLHLKINQEKSTVAPVWERSFLGYRLLSGGTLAVAPKSLKRAKDRLRQITRRNRGISFGRMISEINSFTTGWVTYFRMARCKSHLRRLDEWLRARLRCFRVKQCKRIKPLVDFLKRQGVPTKRAWMGGASAKGWWRTANCPPVNEAMPISWFATKGLMSMAERYATLQFSENRRGT
ncbi:MAG: group II intron reverse transcriptase/maturase [Alphaproteobacteria bacterium]|jgi:RNA-directed DNA polymerase|nr:group II intron reverse transcriptase/maturase [Alphaproteobacteria bacterium]|tara:strand:+ start:481 stop:1896 length:1416 start_codon:yes stop_codon:yes gene_type:complete